MKSKRCENSYFIRIDKGEEIVGSIKKLCKKEGITAGKITGIGATNKSKIGFFNTSKKEYSEKEFIGDFEITSTTGNISTMDDETYLHIHITIADSEHKTFGGHLSSAIVSATFEGIIEKIEGDISRKFNPEIGINELDI
jgi:uncharacterized protein